VTLPLSHPPAPALTAPGPADTLEALRLESDRRLLITVLWVLLVPTFGMAFTDIMIVGNDPAAVAASLWLRALTAIGTAISLRIAHTLRTRAEYERLVLVISVLGTASILALQIIRPPDSLTVTRFEMMMIVGFFTALPNRAVKQALPAITLAIGSLGILVVRPSHIPGYEIVTIAFTFGLAIALGILVTVRRERLQQNEANALRAEQELTAALEQTLSELRVLRGVLPTCAHCRRIRADTGEWQQMELYVREHSEAEFSHGTCPTCAAELYPDIPPAPAS
jgi:hypothetical protein